MGQTYDFAKIEEKWLKRWNEKGVFTTNLKEKNKPKFYNLCMFPYPSAAMLHVGHAYTYSGTDAYGRFKRHLGLNVFQPMGFDAFGIHGENFAIKVNRHPSDVLEENVKNFKSQMDKLGVMFDWSHTVNTSYPDYYKWTQWIFVQLYKNGLVERKSAQVNWCPSCKTVLADEQVIQGRCERCSTLTEKKEMLQWFFKITDYAQRLLDNYDTIDWPQKAVALQKNWIGKSEGAVISFDLQNENGEVIPENLEVFTTRPDTIFGVTFIVISTKHSLIKRVSSKAYEDVISFIKESESQTAVENQKNKAGVFTGIYAKNPLSEDKVPVYVANYVLNDYGTGALMGVPAHDLRDYEFAKKYEIDIKPVIASDGKEIPFEDEGVLIKSEAYDGMESSTARDKIIKDLKKKKKGYEHTTYKLRDWLISRQRYWGPPIPIVYCDDCGPVVVEDLPVFLPNVEDFKPKGDGKSPLANIESFINTTCPKCGGKARRETDVLDNFVDSSWYFLRYPSVGIEDKPFDPSLTKKWLPVDVYIGGLEHAVLHLLYARFIVMALHDIGYLDFEEPFTKLRANGLIIKDGAKMSKSKGNVINPDDYLKAYGADVLRTYLLFIAPFSEGGDFSDRNIVGIVRFLEKVWQMRALTGKAKKTTVSFDQLYEFTKKITEDIESLRYNTAISALMEYITWINKHAQEIASKDMVTIKENFLVMISVFAPFISEEIWEEMGHSEFIIDANWPELVEVTKKEVDIPIQINGKVRSTIKAKIDIDEEQIVKIALNDEIVKKYITGRYKKIVYVKNKILNIIL